MVKVLSPPTVEFPTTSEGLSKLLDLVNRTRGLVAGKYLHWDKIFRLAPPEGVTVTEWWTALKIARGAGRRMLPLQNKTGQFSYSLDSLIESLHKIDQMASGNIQISDRVTNPGTRDRYVVSSLIEEAITSSQLEGASTTRKEAKEMLRSGREPRDRSERMIVNNYLAMQRVREMVAKPLTISMICELHRIVTLDTLDDLSAAGRPQTPEEERVGVYANDDQLLFKPPPAAEIPPRLKALCDFANGVPPSDAFVHPVVRAIIVHFMLAYIHPFADGNGRTARALFYWSMLSNGYWLTEFLTISSILKKAPGKYSRAFLYTETDDDDVTYFLGYQLDVINRAIKELHEYLDRKIEEVHEAERLAKRRSNLNHRQLALLGHAMRNVDARYTIRSHQTSHNVVYQTARSDLLALVGMGLLNVTRMGRTDHFRPPSDLPARLKAA